MLKKLRTLATSGRREMVFGEGAKGVIAGPRELAVSESRGAKKKLVAVERPRPEQAAKFKNELADLCHAMDRNWRMLAGALINRGVPEINADDLAKEACDRFGWLKRLTLWSIIGLCWLLAAFILVMAVVTMTGMFGKYGVTSDVIVASLYSIPLGLYLVLLGLMLFEDT